MDKRQKAVFIFEIFISDAGHPFLHQFLDRPEAVGLELHVGDDYLVSPEEGGFIGVEGGHPQDEIALHHLLPFFSDPGTGFRILPVGIAGLFACTRLHPYLMAV